MPFHLNPEQLDCLYVASPFLGLAAAFLAYSALRSIAALVRSAFIAVEAA